LSDCEPHRKQKPPLSQAQRGFLPNVDETTFESGIWWSRRESNPRPQALHREFYILSSVI